MPILNIGILFLNKTMKKIFIIYMFYLGVNIQKVSADDTEPFCVTCNESNLTADVYIVPPDAVLGQLISGQFYKINGITDKVTFTKKEIELFLKSKGKEFIKIGGDAYFLSNENNKFNLIEVIKLEDGKLEPLNIISADTVIKPTPFINIIIPRSVSEIFNTQR